MKTFFLSRLFREKILLLGLVAVGALWWLSSSINRASAFAREAKGTTTTLAMQQMMIDARDSIEARANAAIRQLDPASTFDTVRLQSELDTIATMAAISNKVIGDAHTDRTSQFSVHSAQITMRNTDYASLVKFYDELKKRTPYIGLEQLTIQSSAANPNQLTASIKVSSVEIAR